MFGETLGALRRCWLDLAIYYALSAVFAVVAASPLTASLLRWLVRSSGDAAVGNLDIVRLLATPRGLTILMVMALVSLVILLGQLAGLLVLGYGAAEGRRFSYYEALELVAMHGLALFRAGTLLLLVFLATVIPFVSAALATGWGLLTKHDINYYLSVRPPEFWLAVAIGAVLTMGGAVAIGLVSLPMVFVVPEVLFRGRSAREAFGASRFLATGYYRQIVGVGLLWLAMGSLAAVLVNAIVLGLGQGLAHLTGDHIATLVTTLAILATVGAVMNGVLHFLATAVACQAIVYLYRDACQRHGVPLPSLESKDLTPTHRHPWIFSHAAPWAAAVGAAGFAAIAANSLTEDLDLRYRVEVCAHRGASRAAPENTLAAVRQAIADGATYVEIDVQRTADGVVVVAHDADLMRVAGVPLVIRHARLDEVRAVDVGFAWGPRFAGERVPTLDEVLDVAAGKIRLLIELKSYGSDPQPLVAGVVQALRDHNMLRSAAVISLNYRETQMVRQLEPRVSTGFIASAALGDISRLNVDFLAVSRRQATDALIGAAHAQGKEVYVWTVDNPREMSVLIDRGVDGILTNEPATLAHLLNERSRLSIPERLLLRFRSLARAGFTAWVW